MTLVALKPCLTAADVFERARRVQARRNAMVIPRFTLKPQQETVVRPATIAVQPPPSPPAPKLPPRPLEALVAQIESASFGMPDVIVIPTSFPKLPQIIKATCQYFHVAALDFLSPRRTHPYPFARQICVYVAIKLTPLSLVQIGRTLHRDHTTILHARDRITDLITAGDEATIDAVKALTTFLTTGERNFPPPRLPGERCRRRQWKMSHEEQLRRLCAAGMSIEDIATALHRTFQSVKKRAWKLRLIQKAKRPKSHWTAEEYATLERLWNAGEKIGAIAEATGRSKSAVRGKVVRAGLKRNRWPEMPSESLEATAANYCHGKVG
jgi:hypothetical protein